MKYGGIAAVSGLAGSAELPTTVHPFILRGVTLAGIDSVLLPISARRELWDRIAGELAPRHLDALTHEIFVSKVPQTLHTILAGGITGRTRVVVKDGF